MNKINSLADKIAGILNSAPSSFDPEDGGVDATNAQLSMEGGEDTHKEEEILSKFRRANVDLLAEVDEKYAGKKTDRRSLREVSDDDYESVLSSNEEHRDDVSEIGDQKADLESNEDVEEEVDFSEGENDEYEGVEDNSNFKHINTTIVANQVKRGICVRNQMYMWESLLEVRIQLQKCLLAANKMPQNAKFIEIKQHTGSELSNKVSEVKRSLCGVLDKFLFLQRLLVQHYPETKNFGKENRQISIKTQQDDEDIPSDIDVEETTNLLTKRELSDYETEIDSCHKKYKNYRNEVIQKWNDKTQVILKAGATSHSVLDQIEYNLNNKEKLIKKTQQKRLQYAILGEDEESEEGKLGEEYNTEIFDDDDFYHQLLRELIEVKSYDVTDPVQLGRQWIQLQMFRSKMKRKIDTKATKGRKIRYAVHNKLVNFMAPIDKELWTDEAKTELYSSLFGKNQP